ncbi:MAG: tail fiber domain-containing protein [Verrucomicrobiota bacterium]
MKSRFASRPGCAPILAVGAAMLVLAFTPPALAASAPPERMTYQGFLVDGNGVALGNTAPKNYDVIFRIFSEQTGGTPLWAEQQTVTVDKGYFSVLLGEGASVNSVPRPALASIFAGPNASDRYVEISVKGIGVAGANVDILPRLRLMASPYAFLAQQATKLVQNDGHDLITSSNDTVVIAGPVTATGVSGNGANLTALNANNITVGTLGADRIASHLTGTRTFAGPVGIGTTSPNALLSLGNTVGNTKLSLQESGPNTGFGIGIQANQFRLHLNSPSARFSFLTSSQGTEVLSLLGNGRLGVNNNNPLGHLHVVGGEQLAGIFDSSAASGTYLSLGNSSPGGRYWHVIAGGSGVANGVGKLLIGSGTTAGTSAARMTLEDSGRVGIGTSTPGSQLEVAGGVRARGGVPGGNGTLNNGYAFSGNGGDNDSGMFSTVDGRVSLFSDSSERLRVQGTGLFFFELAQVGNRRNVQWDPATSQIGTETTSRRYKTNIVTLQDDFAALLKARPVTYTRPASPNVPEIGYIAEELHELGLTRLVDYDQQGRPDAINYEKICLYLNENVKRHEREVVELQAERQVQSEQLTAQAKEIDALRTRLTELERLVRQATAGLSPSAGPTAGEPSLVSSGN